MENGIETNELTVTFTAKTILDHMKGIAAKWQYLFLTSVTLFGVLTASIEAFAFFLSADLRGIRLYIAIILFSLGSALLGTIYSYLHDCPVGYERESATVKRIAQIQRSRWEYKLARQLLLDSLRDLDDELAALEEARVFVLIKHRPDFNDYIHSVGIGPNNVLRMIDVANKLLIYDLPATLGSSDEATKPLAILSMVHRIRGLYSETVAFERMLRSVVGPIQYVTMFNRCLLTLTRYSALSRLKSKKLLLILK